MNMYSKSTYQIFNSRRSEINNQDNLIREKLRQ